MFLLGVLYFAEFLCNKLFPFQPECTLCTTTLGTVFFFEILLFSNFQNSEKKKNQGNYIVHDT